MRLCNPSLGQPFSVHLLVTGRCNLRCEGCFYPASGEWAKSRALTLVKQASALGVRWLAIGGGEPLLWEPLPSILKLAHRGGIKTAVTTNGTILRDDVRPDQLHVSHDPMHPTFRDTILMALRYYRRAGCRVGLNVIASDLNFLLTLPYDEVDEVVYLLPKPWPQAGAPTLREVYSLARETGALVDACIIHSLLPMPCLQGRTSMSYAPDGTVGRCSNVGGVPSTGGLKEDWEKVRLRNWDSGPCAWNQKRFSVRKPRVGPASDWFVRGDTQTPSGPRGF